MQSRQKELETKLEEKQKDTERLEKMLELIKNECNAQVSEKVTSCSHNTDITDFFMNVHAPFVSVIDFRTFA